MSLLAFSSNKRCLLKQTTKSSYCCGFCVYCVRCSVFIYEKNSCIHGFQYGIQMWSIQVKMYMLHTSYVWKTTRSHPTQVIFNKEYIENLMKTRKLVLDKTKPIQVSQQSRTHRQCIEENGNREKHWVCTALWMHATDRIHFHICLNWMCAMTCNTLF